jgi:hypothetical protein
LTQRSRVVLPPPLLPIRLTTSPRLITRSIPSSTRLPPKRFTRCSARMTTSWPSGLMLLAVTCSAAARVAFSGRFLNTSV